MAFARGLNRFRGRHKTANAINWLCSSLGLRKIACQWKVAHEHVSVPFDRETDRALLNLQP